jgi:hypothetical protein
MAPFDPSSGSPPNLLDLMRATVWHPPYLPLFGNAPTLSQGPEDQWQSNSQAAPLPTNPQPPQLPPLGDWPMSQTFTNPLSPETILAQSDQARARPWYAPGAPPSVFDWWLKGAIESADKTIRHFKQAGQAEEDPRKSPECKQEWAEAFERCHDWMGTPDWPKGAGGKEVSLEDCMRGLVSERCGGNPVQRPRPRGGWR